MKQNVIEITNRIFRRLKKENGDVPGWVLVTVMTAGLVTALWLVADGQLSSVLNRAISQVAG
jgi:ribosomal protein L39E